MKLSDNPNIREFEIKDLEVAMTHWLSALYVYLQTPKEVYLHISSLSEIKRSDLIQDLSVLGVLDFEKILTRSLEKIRTGDKKRFKELCEFLLSELPLAAHGVIRDIYSRIIRDEVLGPLRAVFKEGSRSV